jgi:hypothetical protein
VIDRREGPDRSHVPSMGADSGLKTRLHEFCLYMMVAWIAQSPLSVKAADVIRPSETITRSAEHINCWFR